MLDDWARRHAIPPVALAELRAMILPPTVTTREGSEARAQQEVRLEASERGCLQFRNNVGALADDTGRFVRYGLANDTPAMNRSIKSADLILGIPRLITPEMVGTTLLQFGSREIKAPGWRYTGTDRERAQLAWAALILAHGGDAKFATGRGSIDTPVNMRHTQPP